MKGGGGQINFNQVKLIVKKMNAPDHGQRCNYYIGKD